MHYAEFDAEEAAALLAAMKEYESNKWKFIGGKLNKPAKVSQHFLRPTALTTAGLRAVRQAALRGVQVDVHLPFLPLCSTVASTARYQGCHRIVHSSFLSLRGPWLIPRASPFSDGARGGSHGAGRPRGRPGSTGLYVEGSFAVQGFNVAIGSILLLQGSGWLARVCGPALLPRHRLVHEST
jgi:hypothetical protein